MDLRSRSKSMTPSYFMEVTNDERDDEKMANHIEHRFSTRITRSTANSRMTTEKRKNSSHSRMDSSNHSLGKMKNASSRAERSSRNIHHKTSDYSSEDGENVTFNKTINQNSHNQLIEEARNRRSVSNSSSTSNISALDVYRAAGEYWNKYPKTDWTYSRHSKDRFEIAPGVIAMPNMSRRSIHSNDSSSEFLSDKQTNTSFSHDEVDHNGSSYYSRNYSENYSSRVKPKTLFSDNNNYSRKVRSRGTTTNKSIFYQFLSVFTTFFSLIVTYTYQFFDIYNSVYVWFGKKIHKFVSRIMIMDTWLLTSPSSQKKNSRLLALCLLPLLLFGGWWLLSGLGHSVYNNLSNFSSTPVLITGYMSKFSWNTAKERNARDIDQRTEKYSNSLEERTTEDVLKDKTYSIQSQLTHDQLEEINKFIKEKHNDDIIIEKILHTPTIHNIIENYNDLIVKINAERVHIAETDSESKKNENESYKILKQVIENLQAEINKLKLQFTSQEKNRKEELSLLIENLKVENSNYNAVLVRQLNRCCRNSFIQIESSVKRILSELLGAPHPLLNKEEISDWLHSIFVAKSTLEARLANLTSHLKSDFDTLIQNNGQFLMNEITVKISKKIDNHFANLERDSGQVLFKSPTDEYIKDIVNEALAVYDADKTGLVDYAMEPSGGQILSTRCSENYHSGTAVVSILGIPLWYPTNTPRTVITPGVNPGECWAFQNFPGFLVVKLAAPIKVNAVSYEHISKKLMPNGKIDSAPKEFAIYGLRNESDTDPIKVGSYHYDNEGPPLQYFAAQNYDQVFDIIELRVFSNHGNPNYTCLYRLRVHGTLT